MKRSTNQNLRNALLLGAIFILAIVGIGAVSAKLDLRDHGLRGNPRPA